MNNDQSSSATLCRRGHGRERRRAARPTAICSIFRGPETTSETFKNKKTKETYLSSTAVTLNTHARLTWRPGFLALAMCPGFSFNPAFPRRGFRMAGP